MKKILLRIAAIALALILVVCVTSSILKRSHPFFYLREPFVKEVVCVCGYKSYALDEDETETVLASLRELGGGTPADWGDIVFPEGGSSTCFAIRLPGGKTVFFELLPSGIFAIDRNLYHLSGEDRGKDRFKPLEAIKEKYFRKLIEERAQG